MNYQSLIMIVLMLAFMYFFLIRPENKRKKSEQEMRNSLADRPRYGEEVSSRPVLYLCASKGHT